MFYTSRSRIKLYLNVYLFIFYLYFPGQIVEGDYTHLKGGTYSPEVTLVIQRYTGRNFILWHFVIFKQKWWFVSFDLILWLMYITNWWNIRNPSVNFSFKLGLGKGNQTLYFLHTSCLTVEADRRPDIKQVSDNIWKYVGNGLYALICFLIYEQKQLSVFCFNNIESLITLITSVHKLH